MGFVLRNIIIIFLMGYSVCTYSQGREVVDDLGYEENSYLQLIKEYETWLLRDTI